jgi:hypothetical protein
VPGPAEDREPGPEADIPKRLTSRCQAAAEVLIPLPASEAEGHGVVTCLSPGDRTTVSLIHLRVPGSTTVYYQALSRLIDQHGPLWKVILTPER